MTFTPNFNFDFNNNWQFQNQNWNSFQPMFNNNFGNLGGFNGFNFNNIWSGNTSTTSSSSKTSSGDSDYDAWYEKKMKGACSSASGEDSAKTATFLEEKSNEIVKTQALLDDTNKKILIRIFCASSFRRAIVLPRTLKALGSPEGLCNIGSIVVFFTIPKSRSLRLISPLQFNASIFAI